MNKRDLTLEMLLSKVTYNREEGVFTWVDNFGSRARKGAPAGSLRPDGYTHVGMFGFRYLLHHLVWLVETGCMPKAGIDHIDGNCRDSRITNLREADQSQNLCNKRVQSNSKSGIKGVSWSERDRLWCVSAGKNGLRLRSSHKNKDEAIAAYAAYAKNVQGEFHRLSTNGA
jgi:hypothetical protein